MFCRFYQRSHLEIFASRGKDNRLHRCFARAALCKPIVAKILLLCIGSRVSFCSKRVNATAQLVLVKGVEGRSRLDCELSFFHVDFLERKRKGLINSSAHNK